MCWPFSVRLLCFEGGGSSLWKQLWRLQQAALGNIFYTWRFKLPVPMIVQWVTFVFCMRWQAAAKMPPTPSDAGGGFRPYDPSKGGRAASLQGDIKPNFRDMNGEVRGPWPVPLQPTSSHPLMTW
jgi:hypothetical protein